MRWEQRHYAFWLLVVGSWVLGVVYGRWGGDSGIFADLGQAVSVPSPDRLSLWQPILYFTFTVIAAFVLYQIFFGAGAAVFIFSRGVNDALLFNKIELMVGNWKLPSIPSGELWSVFFIAIILTVNLPLCLWAAHLGTQRATRMLYRLRGKPFKSEVGETPIPNLVMVVAASLVAGLIATFALSYALAATQSNILLLRCS
jgi:hypothetical protein